MKTENCLPSWKCGKINSVHESNNNFFIQDLLQEVELNRTQFSYNIIHIFYTNFVQNIVDDLKLKN